MRFTCILNQFDADKLTSEDRAVLAAGGVTVRAVDPLALATGRALLMRSEDIDALVAEIRGAA